MGKSTTSAVFSTLKKLFENWNMGLPSTCVFIDFSRAFDSIDHNIFLKKLKLYGFNPKSVKFIESYVRSRTQCTIVENCKSMEAPLLCGTAQGSILGPLFFTLYVNDIFAYVTHNNCLTMYADDTLLIEQGDTVESSHTSCQSRLKEVEHWCNSNRLCINIDKTKVMTICINVKDRVEVPSIEIVGNTLQSVSKYEYLGVVMDNVLGMNTHIEHITKKVQGKLCILRKIRRFITENVALRIFKCLILCHFDYGDYMVDSGTHVNIEKLDRLYVRTIRCIEYKPDAQSRSSLVDLYHKYKLETLVDRRKRNLLKIMYKESKVELNIDVYRPIRLTRSTTHVKLKHNFTRLTKIQRSPYYRGLELWDKLPRELQVLNTSEKFKNAIRVHKL